jgi:hypothetical protein
LVVLKVVSEAIGNIRRRICIGETASLLYGEEKKRSDSRVPEIKKKSAPWKKHKQQLVPALLDSTNTF